MFILETSSKNLVTSKIIFMGYRLWYLRNTFILSKSGFYSSFAMVFKTHFFNMGLRYWASLWSLNGTLDSSVSGPIKGGTCWTVLLDCSGPTLHSLSGLPFFFFFFLSLRLGFSYDNALSFDCFVRFPSLETHFCLCRKTFILSHIFGTHLPLSHIPRPLLLQVVLCACSWLVSKSFRISVNVFWFSGFVGSLFTSLLLCFCFFWFFWCWLACACMVV